MPYKDPEKYKEWRAANRSKNKDKLNCQKRASDERKAFFCKSLLASFPCIACNELDPDIIEWHHVDPTEKEFGVADVRFSHDRWWNEVLKCVPLCCNCHRRIHKNKLCLTPLKIR